MNEQAGKRLRGRLIRGIGGFYTAKTEEGECFTLRCRKKFRHQGLSPLTGDEVLFTPGEGEKHGWIEEIFPRKTTCLRPPVANVSRLVIVLAPVPEADLLLTDRLISRAAAQGMEVILAVNKSDLDPSLGTVIAGEYAAAGIPVFSVSARNNTGLEPLRESMKGALCCFTGQSGAGKSTLLNALLGLQLETGDLSRKIARGKNTTRQTELIEKDGLQVMDTAGFSLLEKEKLLAPEKLKERYPEFMQYEGQCRFRECLHDREPGCAVQAAADAGRISLRRLERYRVLLSETREGWKERYD
ncbi:MAG: ribosome small subunit-dependent GTPase A [Clostridia bacterium]|nr:ribosome small subunit-dependent GTPase A [Clostridia bacterium]